GAGAAVRQQSRADARRAKVPGGAIRIGGAIAEARLWTAQIGTASLGLPRRAAAGAVAGGLEHRDARAAARAAAARLRGWIRACGRARPVANTAADAAVGCARLSRSVRRAGHVRAGAGRARAARRIAAGRAVARIRAGGRVGSVASACADRTVGSASGPRIARAAGDGRAGARAATLGASLALAGTSRIATDAIDAVLRSALVRAA